MMNIFGKKDDKKDDYLGVALGEISRLQVQVRDLEKRLLEAEKLLAKNDNVYSFLCKALGDRITALANFLGVYFKVEMIPDPRVLPPEHPTIPIVRAYKVKKEK